MERTCTICAETERISAPSDGTEPSDNTSGSSGTESDTTGNSTNSTVSNNNSSNTLSANSSNSDSSNVPKTGDVNYLMILIALLLSGVSGIMAGTVFLKKRSKNK